MSRPEGLHDDEELIAALTVRFSVGMPTSIDGPPVNSMYRPPITQRYAYARWVKNAKLASFPIAGPEMVLGVSSERLLVWKPGLLRARPKHLVGSVPLADIHSAGIRRRVLATMMALLLEDGVIVGVESWRGRHLRALAHAIPSFSENG